MSQQERETQIPTVVAAARGERTVDYPENEKRLQKKMTTTFTMYYIAVNCLEGEISLWLKRGSMHLNPLNKFWQVGATCVGVLSPRTWQRWGGRVVASRARYREVPPADICWSGRLEMSALWTSRNGRCHSVATEMEESAAPLTLRNDTIDGVGLDFSYRLTVKSLKGESMTKCWTDGVGRLITNDYLIVINISW